VNLCVIDCSVCSFSHLHFHVPLVLRYVGLDLVSTRSRRFHSYLFLSPTRSHFLRDTHHHLSLSLHSFPLPPIYSILHPPATGRKLVWQHALAHCVIGATYAGWRHELILSGYQAVVLLLFNQADTLSLSELRRMSALPDKELGTVCALSALWISEMRGSINTSNQ
jgi:hypothetical protein